MHLNTNVLFELVENLKMKSHDNLSSFEYLVKYIIDNVNLYFRCLFEKKNEHNINKFLFMEY
jgi:hypothetical protein